ncbi:hypothetical protein Tcan_04116 [Toxocara canis]|uniref:Uncharacterized protein n=1 Tax=Toxocara canis TaxID=6265 RepID=A0A0B2VGH8_TOXCA|nr:hypothetical protein Tcan_04116 [Toxocara canis]
MAQKLQPTAPGVTVMWSGSRRVQVSERYQASVVSGGDIWVHGMQEATNYNRMDDDFQISTVEKHIKAINCARSAAIRELVQ